MVTLTYDERGFGGEDDINYGNMFKVLLKTNDAQIILRGHHYYTDAFLLH